MIRFQKARAFYPKPEEEDISAQTTNRMLENLTKDSSYQSDRANDPRNLHDRKKTNFNGCLDLLNGLSTGYAQSKQELSAKCDIPMTAIDARYTEDILTIVYLDNT